MMIKITERCTMGCPHCMNDAKSSGRDMTTEVFQDGLKFLQKRNLARFHLIITGGEPLEHRDFDDIMETLYLFQKETAYFGVITFATNGEQLQKRPRDFEDWFNVFDRLRNAKLVFQVSADKRYYPRRVDDYDRIFLDPHIIYVDDCVEHMYPQGRALDNNYAYDCKGSKCFNVRAISKQVRDCKLEDIEQTLLANMKFCTPHIKINGDIGLGESDLCPSCASIYDAEETIIKKIQQFDCHQCDHIKSMTTPYYRQFLEPVHNI